MRFGYHPSTVLPNFLLITKMVGYDISCKIF